jgi:hypothetical protein
MLNHGTTFSGEPATFSVNPPKLQSKDNRCHTPTGWQQVLWNFFSP